MKKKLFAVLSLLGVLSFAAAFGSCNNGGNNDNGGTEIEASWDLSGKSTAEVGETLDFSLAAALFGEEVLTPAIAISIDGGEAFAINGTSYVAGKTGVYTITYTVTYGGKTYTQTETITVRDTQKPTLTKKSGDLPLRAEYGDEIELPVYAAQDNLDGAVTPVIKVYKNDAGKTEIQTQDGGFTVEDYCGYTVEVTAIDSSGNEAKLTETLTVRQEREAEFFENSAYLDQTVYGAGGGIAEYNADRNYVIQGTGSMKFYTTVNGKWISMRVGGIAGLLASQTEEEKSAVKELTFFVYNASPYRANIDFAVFPVSGREKIVKRTATQNGVWTKISVPYSDVVTAYNENAGAQFGIFFNGGDHAADNAYAQFEAYFDCFRLTFNEDAAPSVKINVSDVKSKYEQGATVQFADESGFEHVQTDALKITVKDEAGKTVAYDKTADGKYTIASAAGRYTVNYVYADGDDVSVFMQSISVYLPKEHPEIEGFEESAGDTSFEKLSSSNNTVEITSEKAHSGEKSLKIQNHADVRWGATLLRLDPDMLDLLTKKTVLTFYTYIDSDKKNAHISSFNTRMATYNPDSTDGLKIGSYLNTNANNVATDTWLKHEIYGEKLMQVKKTGGIVLYNELVFASGDAVLEGRGTCDYVFYADDFAVENRYESAIFFDSAAEVERISVTNGEVLSKSYANGGAFIQNGLWQPDTYFKIDLGNGFTEASKGKSQIKIRLILDRFECNATSFNVRFYSYKEGNAYGGQGTHLLQVNGISLNEWIEIVIPADKISAITENALWFDIEEVNASTYWNWKLTIESVTMSATPAWDLSGKSTAEVGETLDFSLAAALFGEEVLTPAIAISIDGGEAFAINGTSYVAGKTGVYTITYTVTYGGKTYTQTETITVRDTQKPTLTKKSGDLPLRAEYGDEIELPVYAAQDNLDGAVTPVIKVYKNDAGKTEIQTQDGGFTVEDYCGYTVEVTAIDSSGNEAKLTETLTVRQEREAEFFENSAYLDQTVYGAGGGIAEYNADRNYVIQGTGSMKFYTTVNGNWISMRVGGIAGLLASQTEEEKSAVKELTFFVYNASPYRANIDFAVFPVSGREKIVKRTATQNGVWTKISVPYSDVVTAYNENAGAQFGIFFNGGDHAADNAYAQFEAYFDCFRLTFNEDAAPSVKINVSDVKSKYEQGATVQFADESGFEHVQTDALKITVKDEAGKTVAYDKTADGKYTIASAAGRYTVNYVYADGDDVSVFMQSISVYLPKEHPEIEGFEESAGDTSFEKLSSSNNTVEITSEKAHSGEKSLKIQNHADVRWGATLLRLDPDMLDLLTKKTVLTFYTYIDSDKKNAHISSFNTRMATYNPDSTDGLKIGSYLNTNANNVATDTWLKHEIYGEKLMQVKKTGGIVLYNELVFASGDAVLEGRGTCDYVFYADDFAVENRYESAIFFDSAAEVERISVTNGEVLSKSYANGGAFIQNGLWQPDTYFKIDLGNGFTEASKGKSQIKIRLILDRFECNATSFNVRFYSYKEGNAYGGQGTHLLQVNGISLNEWIEIVIPADKISAITENALWFDIEEVNASTYWNWKLTIESVTMSEAAVGTLKNNVTAESQSIATEFNEVKKLTDESGNAIAFTFGADKKLTVQSSAVSALAAGEYNFCVWTEDYAYTKVKVAVAEEVADGGFENVTRIPDSQVWATPNNKVSVSSTEKRSGINSLKTENHADSRWAGTELTLSEDLLNQIGNYSVLNFYVYISSANKNSKITGFNLRMSTYDADKAQTNPNEPLKSKNTFTYGTGYDGAAMDTWIKVQVSGSDLALIKSTKTIVLYNELCFAADSDAAGNCNYEFYVDDFSVEEASERVMKFNNTDAAAKITEIRSSSASISYDSGYDSVLIHNGLWEANGFYKIQLDEGFLSKITENSTLTIKVLLDKYEYSASAFKLQLKNYLSTNKKGGVELLDADLENNKWVEYTLNYAQLSQITENALWLYVYAPSEAITGDFRGNRLYVNSITLAL